ncbi:N6-mAMP deaminase-like [Arachis duranensis]|uniref:N6-mAMP deaminase-like n=1 Tax=Arachis duranensis TaxID=130453 RepID=A0A9C6TA00_ARADU|nr:N6-mAMP deaminase-like [Arachis duranensis]
MTLCGILRSRISLLATDTDERVCGEEVKVAVEGEGKAVILSGDEINVRIGVAENVEIEKREMMVVVGERMKNDSQGMSKRSYVEAVLEGIRSVSSVDVALIPYTEDPRNLLESLHAATNDKCDGNSRKKIFVRLLLSADRRETTEATMETVKLALEMRHLGVVGIDLSGNLKVGEWFLIQRRYKTCSILFPIIGHACFFEEEHWRKLKSTNISG